MTTACLDMAAASRGQPGLGETFSDEKLIQRIAAGDRLAMRTLFARHRVAVYRWLLRLVNDEALAEDLLSDVFLDVWRKAASFEARASVSTWLLAIARTRPSPHAGVEPMPNWTTTSHPLWRTLRTVRTWFWRRKARRS
jgi:Sigma-70 region 2